jgi:putative heme-binding domain-containing protein
MAIVKSVIVLLAARAVVSAQAHNYTKADMEEGIQRYRTNCIGCHGIDGTSVSGIDLSRGKFRRVSSDEEIVNVIVNGVPGTGMPPTSIPHARAYTIVAFMRTMNDTAGMTSIAAASGDPARGKTLFENKGGCMGCHRIQGRGGRSGPDLSEAGLTLRGVEIERSMLDPDAEYSLNSRPFRVVQKNGTAVMGMLLNQDSYSVQLRDDQGDLRSFAKSDLRESGPVKSPMPSYRDKLDPQELADIIAYAVSQRGAQ